MGIWESMILDSLDHGRRAWSPAIACLSFPGLPPGLQSLFPGAIFSRADISSESIPLPCCLWRGEAPGKIVNVPLVCPHAWHKAPPSADRAGAGKVGREARGQEPGAHSPYTEFLKEILEIQEWYIHPTHQEGAFVKVGRLKTFHRSLAFFVTLHI